jgi:hypothetical protein
MAFAPLALGARIGRVVRRRAGAASPARAPRLVRPLERPAREAETPAERFVVSLLAKEGPLPFTGVTERLARWLYAEALRRSGWVTDIGIFGSTLFHAEAARALEAGAGSLWLVEPGEGER